MHFYSYDGCDSDSHGSDPLSCSDSEASGAESRRSLIIFLDDDDEDEVEEPVHPLPSHRPKKPLPKNFGRGYHSPTKEETTQGMKTPLPEVYHTINCAPELRNKSLEVRPFFITKARSHLSPSLGTSSGMLPTESGGHQGTSQTSEQWNGRDPS